MQTFNISSRIGFIGAGVVGTCLALGLSQKGYRVKGVASRSFSLAKVLASRLEDCLAYSSVQEVADASDVVFITTPDDAIGQVASTVSWRSAQGVLHCSGAATLDVLEPAKRQGALVGGFHPFQTFSSVEEAVKALPGTTFAIEGEPPIGAFLENAALALGGRPLFLKPGDRVLYHASAVMACGFTVTLAKLATDLWKALGFQRENALEALLPLLRGTIESMGSVGIPQALTGPLARGDVGTMRKHLDALEANAPEVVLVYCHLALAQLPIALEKGNLAHDTAKEIQALLERYLHKETSLLLP